MAFGIRTNLDATYKRISAPASELRDMLVMVGGTILQVPKEAQVYFVDEENGSDSDSGLSWLESWASLTYAFATCDANYDDDALYYVFVAPGNYAEDDLLFAGHGLHLIGVGIPGRDSGVHVVAPDNASAYGSIAMAASNCEIANICFEIGASVQPVLYAVAMDNCWVHNCRFYSDSVPTNVCVVEAHDIRNSIFSDNWFFGGATYGWYQITGADKYLIETLIKDNIFCRSSVGGFGSGAKGIFLHADPLCYGTVIRDNDILMGEVAGSPIGIDDDSGQTDGVMIRNNYVAVPSGKTPIESANGIILGNHTDAGGTIVDPNAAKT